MASDRGKQQAYCKVCSKHFSVSHGGIDDVRRHGEGKKHLELQNGFLKKITDFPRVFPHSFFRNLTCLLEIDQTECYTLTVINLFDLVTATSVVLPEEYFLEY